MSPLLLRALLAALPLLGVTLEWESGFVDGAMIVAILFLSVLIFRGLSSVIPQSLYRICFLLLLILSATAFRIFFGGLDRSTPLLLASLFLLVPPDLFRNPNKGWTRAARKTFLTSLYFWILVAGHAVFCDLLGSGMGIRFFQSPAGSYFLMGTALAVFPKTR